MIKKICCFVLILLSLGSCVPNKKIVYLQHNGELNDKNIPKDSILREHEMQITQYRIQPLDLISVNFESITSEEYDFFSKISPSTNLSGNNRNLNGVLVDVDGNIEYPVVGKVHIAGLTVFEAQDKVQTLANQFLTDAVVRIRLLNFRFTILGEVGGEKVVTSSNTRVTIMEAIGLTGGFSELADRSNIKVIRQVGNSSQIFYINLLEEEFIESKYFYVQQNDIIIVPPLRQRTFKRYFSQNIGLFTSTISAVLFIATLLTR